VELIRATGGFGERAAGVFARGHLTTGGLGGTRAQPVRASGVESERVFVDVVGVGILLDGVGLGVNWQ